MKQTNTDRMWIIGGAVGAIAVIALAWLFVVSPEFNKVSSLKSQTADAQAQNITMEAKVRSLQNEYAKLPDLQASLTKARTSLPTESGLTDFTRTVAVNAATTGVSVTSMAVGTIGTTSATGGTATTSKATGNPAGSVFAIPVSIIAKGTTAHLIAFEEMFEGTGKRAALVGSTQLTADPTTKGVQLSMQVSVFAAPQTPAQQAELQKLMASTPN